MKLKLNNVKAFTKLAAVVVIFAVAGLAGAGFTYAEILKNIEMGERDSELTSRLVEAVRYDSLLKKMDSDSAVDAKQYVTSELESEVKQIRELSPETTADTKEFAGFVVTQIDHTLRKNSVSPVASNLHVIAGEAATLAAQKAN